MKIYAAVAMLLSVPAQAGELLPMSGEESSHMSKALVTQLQSVVDALPDAVTVEPVLESIKIHGRGKRIVWGPLAGSSHIVLRLRITEDGRITDEVISTKSGAWKGTFKPGQDYAMVDRVAQQAAAFVANYSALRFTAR
jgi:hypothetical protein